ncbi:hypothetical protein DER44DRAFT_783599 [Fusarium oxysporum]|nr:hypothetical protein DER44DRAFT_783599 [Fusarium oxysporum]
MSLETRAIVFAGISSGMIGGGSALDKDHPWSQAKEMCLAGLGFGSSAWDFFQYSFVLPIYWLAKASCLRHEHCS